jgi:hypothetical protein
MIEQKSAGSSREPQKQNTASQIRHMRIGPRARWRIVLLVPSFIGIAGLSTINYKAAAVLAMLVGLLEVVGNLFLQKRRDDLLAETAKHGERKIDLIRALSEYEAVRSRQLTSDGIVRLLRPLEPDHHDPGEASPQ